MTLATEAAPEGALDEVKEAGGLAFFKASNLGPVEEPEEEGAAVDGFSPPTPKDPLDAPAEGAAAPPTPPPALAAAGPPNLLAAAGAAAAAGALGVEEEAALGVAAEGPGVPEVGPGVPGAFGVGAPGVPPP